MQISMTSVGCHLEPAQRAPNGLAGLSALALFFAPTVHTQQPDAFALHCEVGKAKPLATVEGNAGGPAVSPDGRRVAFHVRHEDDSDIYLFDLETRDLQPLPTGPANEGRPTWSPDGREIAFQSNRGGDTFQIWAIPLATQTPRQVTHAPSHALQPHYSPEGRSIAYAGINPELEVPPFNSAAANVWVVPSAGGVGTRVTNRDGEWRPRWSPDGTLLSHYGNGGVWWIDLHTNRYRLVLGAVDGFRADWSRNGDHVVFVRTPGDHAGDTDLWIAETRGSLHRAFQLTRDQAVEDDPVWAGDTIVFSRSTEEGSAQLFMIEIVECQ